MREFVDAVEARLLRHEPRHPRLPTDLRNLARESKRIREPRRCRPEAELSLEEALSVQELAHQRLAAREVGIVLDPGATDGVELSRLDLGLDALPAVRVDLLEPFELRVLATS
jgi:hypothetical protein